MKPPATLPSTLVALGEAYARRAGIDPGDFWAYVYKRRAPPPELRAVIVDAFFPRVRPGDFLGLTTRGENDTLATMTATEIEPARRGRPLTQQGHPFVAMLKRRGLTVAEVAAKVKRAPSTVKAWYKATDAADFRPIPRVCALKIAELYQTDGQPDVPLSAWARIAD